MKRLLTLVGLSLVACTSGAAEMLGPLFYTPAQRAELDALRNRKQVAPPAPEPEQPVPLPEVVKYDGIVRSSDGRTTVWINRRPVEGGKSPEGAALATRVGRDHRMRLTLPQDGREIELKVGQSVELVSGSIVEPYARPSNDRDATPEVAAPDRAALPSRTPPRPADDEDEERPRR